MKNSLRILLAMFALLGILNCFVLEPALAMQEETTCAIADGCDDCFLCCSAHYQSISSITLQLTPSNHVSEFILHSRTFHPDSPTFSIFHPPIAR